MPRGVRWARTGVAWIGWSWGVSRLCRAGGDNLCPGAGFTGAQLDGGSAEWTTADQRFLFPIPDRYPVHRSDGEAFIAVASRIPIPTEVTAIPLARATLALDWVHRLAIHADLASRRDSLGVRDDRRAPAARGPDQRARHRARIRCR